MKLTAKTIVIKLFTIITALIVMFALSMQFIFSVTPLLIFFDIVFVFVILFPIIFYKSKLISNEEQYHLITDLILISIAIVVIYQYSDFAKAFVFGNLG